MNSGDGGWRWMLRTDEDRDFPRGAGSRPAGLTGIRISQEGVLILMAPQRGCRRRLVLGKSREAGDAHVVHRRVGAQGAFLAGFALRRHPHPHPPAAQRLPEVAGAGVGVRGRRAGPELLDSREGAPPQSTASLSD